MISYLENIIDTIQAEELEEFLMNHSWVWGSSSTPHMAGSVPHWTIVFSGALKPHEQLYNCEIELKDNIIKKIWSELQHKFFYDDILVRCYANAITKGIDQRIHTDDTYQGSKTLIIYVNKIWNVDWAGETIIWDKTNRQIIGSYLPKFNHGLLIDGNSWHGVRPVSTYCNHLRMTLMFKTRPKTYLGELNASVQL